jgi:hypothetical protein
MFMRDAPPSFSASFSACCVGDARDRDPPPPRGILSLVFVWLLFYVVDRGGLPMDALRRR